MPDEERSGGFLNYLPAILWQRRWIAIPPFVLLSAAGIAAAALLPTTYQSAAKILVEAQELPAELVSAPVTSLLDQRIAKIRQQVLSRGDLIELIERLDLYEEERRTKPLSGIVDEMREAIKVEAVTGNLGQTENANTIAFTLSYDYRDPAKAQAVVQNLVERFLEIDTSNTAEQAGTTVTFLQEQSGNLQRQIAAIEGQITSIKAQNGMALSNSGIPTGGTPASYDAQIGSLQSENRQLLARLQRRVVTPKDPLVAQAEAQLAVARATYADGHPDVALAEQRLAQVRALARGNVVPVENDNALIQSQVAANNATIAALQRARSVETERLSSSMANSARAPVIMEQISQLDGRANALRSQYQEVAQKLVNAQNSARMTQEQKGERLTVIEPPVVPDSPTSPNPLLLILGGLLLGAGLGVLLALVVEMILKPIRGVDQIEGMGLDALAVVPTFKPDKSRLLGRLRSERGRGAAPLPAQG